MPEGERGIREMNEDMGPHPIRCEALPLTLCLPFLLEEEEVVAVPEPHRLPGEEITTDACCRYPSQARCR